MPSTVKPPAFAVDLAGIEALMKRFTPRALRPGSPLLPCGLPAPP